MQLDTTEHNTETVNGLAARLNCHPESVRRLIRNGKIKAIRFGKQWRIPSAEVSRILSNGI